MADLLDEVAANLEAAGAPAYSACPECGVATIGAGEWRCGCGALVREERPRLDNIALVGDAASDWLSCNLARQNAVECS